jgi:hypothetical protein
MSLMYELLCLMSSYVCRLTSSAQSAIHVSRKCDRSIRSCNYVPEYDLLMSKFKAVVKVSIFYTLWFVIVCV